MKKALKILGIMIIVLSISFYSFFFLRDAIGVSKDNIEKDARASHHIDDNWLVSMETTDKLSTMIFYPGVIDPKHPDNHIFAIYENDSGLSFGYHFKCGGSGNPDNVFEYRREGKDRAFLSMNRQQVSKMEIDDGSHKRTMEVNSKIPFAFVIPANDNIVVFYDINGNVVESVLL